MKLTKHIARASSATLLAFLCLGSLAGQKVNPQLPVPSSTQPSPPPIVPDEFANDPCGDPRMESTGWLVLHGEVVKVFNGESVLFAVSKTKRIRVQLVGISVPPLTQAYGREAKEFVERQVLQREIDVLVNPSDWMKKPKPEKITGMLYLADGDRDVNLALIKEGLAHYKEPKPYGMSSYEICKYQNAETEARALKRGVWRVPA